MMRSLYGQPYLVLGIARSGTAVAAAFAQGSGASETLAVDLPRRTSVGFWSRLRAAWTRVAPRFVRRLYKAVLFPSVVRLMDWAVPADPLPHGEADRIRKAMAGAPPGAWVAVVDDSIDSGQTVQRVVHGIEQLAKDARVLVFALSSSLGRNICEHQLTLVSGEIAHFTGGDLARMDRVDLLGGPRTCLGHTPKLDPLYPPDRRLYLDLDGTLSADSFRDAARALAPSLAAHGRRLDAWRFRSMRLAKKLRMIDHRKLKVALDVGIRSLEGAAREAFMERVAKALRENGRTALATIGRSPGVRTTVVTAALASYADAIESAFGFPVLTGSGPGPDGAWIEIGSDQKVEAIATDCGSGYGQWLVVGDTRVDALTASHHLTVISVPKWDTTGLTTILGLSSWWRGPGPLASNQLLDGDAVMRRIIGGAGA